MQITYNPEFNIAYIRLQPKRKGDVRTIEIHEGDINIDLAPDGTLYGIELLNANEQLKADGNVLQLINEQSHQTSELPL